MKYMYKSLLLCSILGGGLWACSEKEGLTQEPYGPGAEPLAIVVDRAQAPAPASGLPGTEVTIKASGLAPYADELTFQFNGEMAEIAEITDQQIKVIVPDFASTGITSITVGDVVVFGPQFSVTGRINPDPTFNAARGTNNNVAKVIFTNDDRMMVVGSFTDYDNKGIIRPINRIARAFADGTYDASLRSGIGASGELGDIIAFDGGYLIGGAFNGYSQRGADISNLTKIHPNGTIDTMGVKPFRRPDQTDTTKYYPRFNGGFDGYINNLYEQNGQVLVSGSFRYYLSRQYDQPNRLETRDSVIVDSVEVRQLARLNADGSLDKTYRFDVGANRSWEGGNGFSTALLHAGGTQDGKLLVYGGFTRFDGQNAGYLTRLLADGTIDPTFNPGGAGADQPITSAYYNPATNKYLIAGQFKNYNGSGVSQLAMLNEDGTLDESFVPATFEGGSGPNFVKQLSDGKIIVSGFFRSYNGIARNGFMVLDETGALLPGYNATGLFSGFIEDIIETTSSDGRRALLIYGQFSVFNSQPAYNYTRVLID